MLPIDQDPLDPNPGTNDVLEGTSWADKLEGWGGNDQLFGYAGNDQLYGGLGNDLLVGGAGKDYLNGGAGTDTVSFAGESVAVEAGVGGGYISTGDTLVSIENLIGSSYNDFLIGNDSGNVLEGGDGADTLKGWNGNDTLRGGNGTDWISADRGNDILSGGSGADTFYFNWGLGGNPGPDHDKITDFVSGQDKLMMLAENYDAAVQLGLAELDTNKNGSVGAGDKYCTVDANGLTLDYGRAYYDIEPDAVYNEVVPVGANTVTLMGVTSLSASDFII